MKCYIRGLNLTELQAELDTASLIVTYNGTLFDLPKLEQVFQTKLNIRHLDLRSCLENLGFRG